MKSVVHTVLRKQAPRSYRHPKTCPVRRDEPGLQVTSEDLPISIDRQRQREVPLMGNACGATRRLSICTAFENDPLLTPLSGPDQRWVRLRSFVTEQKLRCGIDKTRVGAALSATRQFDRTSSPQREASGNRRVGEQRLVSGDRSLVHRKSHLALGQDPFLEEQPGFSSQ